MSWLGLPQIDSNFNEIIKRHHPDVSALRSEMIGEHLLQREHGVYWRV